MDISNAQLVLYMCLGTTYFINDHNKSMGNTLSRTFVLHLDLVVFLGNSTSITKRIIIWVCYELSCQHLVTVCFVFLFRPDGQKKAYVRLAPDYDALDVSNKVQF